MSFSRRTLLGGAAATAFVPAAPYVARAADTPGVTDTEIRIGSTAAYSGPGFRLWRHRARPCGDLSVV